MFDDDAARALSRAGDDGGGMGRGPGSPRGLRVVLGVVVAVAAVVAGLLTVVGPASAQPAPGAVSPQGTQRGPDPTIQSIEASRGPFATAQQAVAPGNGFN